MARHHERDRGGLPIDDLDRKLIDLLRSDCQATNRAIAKQLGINEATVASRINGLVEAGAIRFALQRNLYTWGYRTLFAVRISVRGRSVEEVGAELSSVEEVIIVSVVAGEPQLVVVGRARCSDEVHEIVGRSIRCLDGVRHAETSIILETLKFASGVADMMEE